MPRFFVDPGPDAGMILSKFDLPDVAGEQLKSAGVRKLQDEHDLAPVMKQRQQERLTSDQLSNQEKTLDLNDQQYGMDALHAADGDPEKYLMILRRSGARPKFVMGQMQAISNLKHTAAQGDELARKNEVARHDQMLGDLASLEGMPEEQRAQAWPQMMQAARQRNHLSDQEFQQYSQAYPEYPGSETVQKVLMPSLKLGSTIFAEAQKQAEQKRLEDAERRAAERWNVEKPGQQADAFTKGLQAAGQAIQMVNDQESYDSWKNAYPEAARNLPAAWNSMIKTQVERMSLTPAQRSTADMAKSNAERAAIPNTPTELAMVANDRNRTPEERAQAQAALKELERHAKASRPQMSVNMPGVPGLNETGNLTGEAVLAKVPVGLANEIRAMAEGRTVAPSPNSRAPGAQQKRALLMQYDPSWSEQRAQLRKAFLTGPDGRNVRNLNTAAVHLGQLVEASEAMKNGTWQPGNRLYQYIAEKFGSDKPTNFTFVVNAFAGEAANALKGQATDPEIAHILSGLQREMSPEQAHGVGSTGLHVLGAKLNTFDESYHSQSTPDDTWTPILPSAKAVFERYGQNPIVRTQGGGRGQTTYRKIAVGQNGHRIGTNDGRTWFDLQTGQRIQ